MRAHHVFSVISIGLTLAFVSAANGQKKPQEKDSVQRDYSKDLTRVKPKSPQEALKTFKIAPGFRIELVAAEPLVADPVAMAFDEQGRLFVVEMRGYSEDGDKNLGRVKLLYDTNRDGVYDRATVYASGLSWPTAVACYDGGVFVGAAPNIHYFKDTNGDGRADVKRIVFTGFGRGNVQGLLNTFKWGLDNRIHGATSSSGARITRGPKKNSGKTGKAKEKPLVLRGRDFAIEPRELRLSPMSGGGQHGLSFNQWGEKFVCSNSNHIQYVLFDDRYMGRNPFLATPSARRMIAADGPQADVFRFSPVEPWRIIRTRLRVKGIVRGPVERGGKAAGYFTGSTGITIYRGDMWNRSYQGWAIIGDVGSNLIHRKRLQRRGIGWLAERVDQKSEFVASSDVWFRPVQFANGPDGALYVADMYREVIEHPLSLPPVLKRHLDLTSGRTRGRIYRIVPEKAVNRSRRTLPDISRLRNQALVALLAHPNGWHRDTAARLLYERRATNVVRHLRTLVRQAQSAYGRIHGLYALRSLQALEDETLLVALSDRHPRVREHAVKLSEPFLNDSARLSQRVLDLANDNKLRVRYQVAFSLGQLSPSRQRTRAIARILQNDATDLDVVLAASSSLGRGAGETIAALTSDAKWASAKAGKSVLTRLARQVGRQQRPADVAAVLGVLRSRAKNSNDPVLLTLVTSLAAKRGSSLANQIQLATGGQSSKVLQKLLEQAAVAAANRRLPVAKRRTAIHLLRLANPPQAIGALKLLLRPTEPAAVQTAALTTMSSFNSVAVPNLLVEQWNGLTPSLRRQAANTILSRDAWLPILFAGLKAKKILPRDLEPGRLQLLAKHRSAEIRRLAAPWNKRNSARAQVVRSYQKKLAKLTGRAVRGKLVFKKNCSTCHQVAGVGHALGPNIMAMRNRGPNAILTNVLDPNREVNPKYLNYIVATEQARVFSGMIEAESATSITLTRAEKKSDTILRIDIANMKSTGVSLMPDGLEKEIKPQDMADLIAFLMSL